MFLKTFSHAFRGIFITFQKERNAKIHLLFVILVTLLSLFLKISLSDYIIFLLLFALVLSSEFLNTCIEQICNILRDKYKLPYADSRNIRDIAAGAVLVNAIIAAIIGFVTLLKYLPL